MDTWTWQSGSDYLVHYGTPMHSGRYPWGSGERPRQRLEGIGNDPRSFRLTSEEKKLIRKATRSDYDGTKSSLSKSEKKALRRALAKQDAYRQAKRNARQERRDAKVAAKEAKRIKDAQREEEIRRSKEEAAAKKAEETKRQVDAERAAAIANGDRSEILKLFNELSNAELRTAIERINFKEQMSRIPQEQTRKGKSLLESTLPKLKAASELIGTVYTIKTGLERFSKSDDSKIYKQVTDTLSKLQKSNGLSGLDLSKLDFSDGKFASKVKETNNMVKNLQELQRMLYGSNQNSDSSSNKKNKNKNKNGNK